MPGCESDQDKPPMVFTTVYSKPARKGPRATGFVIYFPKVTTGEQLNAYLSPLFPDEGLHVIDRRGHSAPLASVPRVLLHNVTLAATPPGVDPVSVTPWADPNLEHYKTLEEMKLAKQQFKRWPGSQGWDIMSAVSTATAMSKVNAVRFDPIMTRVKHFNKRASAAHLGGRTPAAKAAALLQAQHALHARFPIVSKLPQSSDAADVFAVDGGGVAVRFKSKKTYAQAIAATDVLFPTVEADEIAKTVVYDTTGAQVLGRAVAAQGNHFTQQQLTNVVEFITTLYNSGVRFKKLDLQLLAYDSKRTGQLRLLYPTQLGVANDSLLVILKKTLTENPILPPEVDQYLFENMGLVTPRAQRIEDRQKAQAANSQEFQRIIKTLGNGP